MPYVYPGKRTPDQRAFAPVTLSTAADGLSEIVDCGGLCLGAIDMGAAAAWTDAPLTFRGSFDSSASMRNLFNSTGGEISMTTTGGRMQVVDPALFAGLRFLQVRSGDASTAVAQAAARSLRFGLAVYQPIK